MPPKATAPKVGAAFVLDACSLIALLRREPGSEKVVTLLEKAEEKTIRLLVHRVTMVEVYYDVLRASGKEKADLMMERISRLPIVQSQTLSTAFIAVVGHFKIAHKISFADAFVLALAQTQGASVVSSDHHEFDPIARSGILSFHWIR